MAKKRNNYSAPAVLGVIPSSVECDLLAASIVDNTSIQTTKQGIGDVFEDASSTGGSSFNHNWGNGS